MAELALLVLLLVAAIVLIGVPFAVSRLRGADVLRIVQVGGIAYAGLIVAITAGTVIPLIGGNGQISVPLRSDAISRPRNVSFDQGPLAHITGGSIDHATLALTGLGVPTRILLIAAALVLAAVSVTIALALSRIAASTLHGAPFGHGIARVVVIAAIAIVIGGTLASVLQQWGEWSAAQDAFAVTSWSATHVTDPNTTLASLGWPTPGDFALQIPFLPLLLGLGLGAVAAVFRAGERLQRDTAGLV